MLRPVGRALRRTSTAGRPPECLFENALTPAPITLPAHASLLTGLLPRRHGVRDNGIYRLPDDVPTLASTLSHAGYATAAVVGSAILDREYGLARGFQHYDDAVGQGGWRSESGTRAP